MLVIPLMARMAPRLGLIDQPDARKIHRAPVPRVGGWGMVLGALLAVAASLPLDPALLAWGAGTLVLFGFGVVDDHHDIGHYPKFAGQLIAVGLVVFGGGLYVERLPFLGLSDIPPFIGIPFTLFALVGAINATNHSDGLDGLAGGETLLSLIVIGFLAWLSGESVLLGVTAAAAGGILGFLRFNTHPARVFMGDAGSQFLGFTVAFLALYLTQRANTALSAALPLLILGLPIADILMVLYLRIRGGLHWFKATRNHIHHRLLDLGFDHYGAVVLIYSVQTLLVTSAVWLRFESDWLVTGVYLGVCAALFGTLGWMEGPGRAVGRRSGALRLSRLVDGLSGRRALLDAPIRLVAVLLPAYLLAGALAVEKVSGDFGLVSASVATLLLAEALVLRRLRPLSRRLAVYVAAAFVVYLVANRPLGLPLLGAPEFVVGFHVLLALAIGLAVRDSRQPGFSTTPMDYLLVFGLVAASLFAGQQSGAQALLETLLKAAVVLYGCELLLVGEGRGRLLTVTSLAVLAVFAWRGLG